MINTLVVVNPVSGRTKIRSFLVNLIVRLISSDRRTEVMILNRENRIIDFLEGKDEIVCCGGDGTLNSVINAVLQANLESKIKIGYIPCGSTNDFARGIGIPTELSKATDAIVNGTGKRLDVGVWNNETAFSYVASFGAFSKTSYSTPQELKNALGHFAYILNGIADVCAIRPIRVKVTAENKEIDDKFCFGAVLNATSVGGVLKIDKTIVDLSDGLFEVLLVKKPKNLIELNNLLASISASSFASPFVSFFKCEKCVFEFDEEIDWSLDGEEKKGEKKVEIKNEKKKINIILP